MARLFMSPAARLFRSAGCLAVQAGMTYRAASAPTRAQLRAAQDFQPLPIRISAIAFSMPPKTTDGQGHLLWGGRFSAKPGALMQAINVSIGFDKRLAGEDLAGSKAHVTMLGAQGIISADDQAAILRGLDQIEAEMAAGTFPFR